MNYMQTPFLVASLLIALLHTGCQSDKASKTITADSTSVAVPVSVDPETELLLKDLAENGDYVNSREFPSLIKASVVFESLGSNIQVIDLRVPAQYADGHIQGAVNKRFEDLPDYFETGIKPFEKDKIILVCEDGQISSYAASLLRLMGYGNVFAMRWGMSAWNRKYAEAGWLKGVSGKYESSLEQSVHEKPLPAKMPSLGTGLNNGAEISAARLTEMFAAGTKDILITADDVFAHPEQYYIINLERKDKYDDGHIPGAVRYKPNATLGIVSEMATIPTDKPVVLYCGTGHNSGFATAYLRLFGYDARTLQFGNNGFMHDKMVKQNAALSWLPFSDADINDFPVVK